MEARLGIEVMFLLVYNQTNPEILEHYGIKGMKWGIRRTESQLQRTRGKLESNANRSEVKRRKSTYKNRRTISDDDLHKEVSRLELEKKFKNLVNEDIRPGRTAVQKFLKSTGGRVVTSAAVGAMAYAGYLALGGNDPDGTKIANYLFPNPNRKK